MKDKLPIIMEAEGEIVDVFPSMRDAANALGVHVSAIRWRLDRKEEVKGVLLRPITDEESKMLRSAMLELLNRDRRGKKRPPKSKPGTDKKKVTSPGADDMELDSEKYTIVPYEQTNSRVCITPCPYRDSPKPKVGSALCLSCPSFHGRNRTLRQVACNAVEGRSPAKKKSKNEH